MPLWYIKRLKTIQLKLKNKYRCCLFHFKTNNSIHTLVRYFSWKQVTKMDFAFAVTTAQQKFYCFHLEFFVETVASLPFLVCSVSFSKQMQNSFTTNDRSLSGQMLYSRMPGREIANET